MNVVSIPRKTCPFCGSKILKYLNLVAYDLIIVTKEEARKFLIDGSSDIDLEKLNELIDFKAGLATRSLKNRLKKHKSRLLKLIN